MNACFKSLSDFGSLLANDQLVVVLQKFLTWCFFPLSPRVEENCFDS
jgi:hypothetical protein